jgi:hypothetical protein
MLNLKDCMIFYFCIDAKSCNGLKVVANEKGEAVGEVVTIIC